jgi:MFS family permease
MAIPVGSALGYAFGGWMNGLLGWQWAFYLVTPPGLLLAFFCFSMREPRKAQSAAEASRPRAQLSDYKRLLRIPSLVSNTVAQTALTFAIGGLQAWVPTYINKGRGQPLASGDIIFGGILVVAGLTSTLFGGWIADKLRARIPGSYFIVSGVGLLLGIPPMIAMLFTPFPWAWIFIFISIFFLFMNTGPSNTALANVTPPSMRATAFALNILIIHLFGDASSPPLLGWISDHDHHQWNKVFYTVAVVMFVGGIIWLCGAHALVRDTEAVEKEEGAAI